MRKSSSAPFHFLTYLLVIGAYVALQVLQARGELSATMRGMLVPICAYVVMAVSLNLTVGVLGELSLGHAGFMSVGAFLGTSTA
ncbi:MAG: branched-chain amino acid ABC transporter permease, partial [Oscillibacter sp.]|nr:branched-chain amino acid ABC transporter permease [Oscillibacter sp.]